MLHDDLSLSNYTKIENKKVKNTLIQKEFSKRV